MIAKDFVPRRGWREDHDAAIRALELIATEVEPTLGWKPATGSPGVRQLSDERQTSDIGQPSDVRQLTGA